MPVYEKCKVFTCKYACNLPVIIDSAGYFTRFKLYVLVKQPGLFFLHLFPTFCRKIKKNYFKLFFLYEIVQDTLLGPNREATWAIVPIYQYFFNFFLKRNDILLITKTICWKIDEKSKVRTLIQPIVEPCKVTWAVS